MKKKKVTIEEAQEHVKAELDRRIELMDSGEATFYSIEGVDAMLDERIKKYEH